MLKGVRAIPRARQSAYICDSCLGRLALPSPRRDPPQQRRWITRNHIQMIKTAEEEWAIRAEAIEAGRKMSMLDLLEQRGYINQLVGPREQLNHIMTNRRVGAYVGIDPTAPSMHVGHMVPFMVLGWLYVHGYSVNFLLGGTTARIGDPTDRLNARDDVHRATRKANMASMHMQLKRLGELIERYASRKGYTREWAWKRALVNNNDWWTKTTLVEFMRVLGSGARIGPMLGRDTVKNRLEKGDGMSFAEFSYPLIQAYDWWQLYQRGVQIQIGGADQFGNILAGAEMVKYMTKNDPEATVTPQMHPNRSVTDRTKKEKEVSLDPMGFTTPLLTTASGEKLGKSAGNAVWLDPDMTSSYDLYQYFLRAADADVERYLKLLTFVPLSEITEVIAEHKKNESKRVAQHRLAKEFVELVHGIDAATKAEQDHRQMFSRNLSIRDLGVGAKEPAKVSDTTRPADVNPSLNKHAAPARIENNMSTHMTLPVSLVEQQPLSKILWCAGLVASRSEGQRLINNRGVHVGSRSDGHGGLDDALTFTPATHGSVEEVKKWILDGELLILRIGKWKMKIIKIVPDRDFKAAGGDCPGWNVGEEENEEMAYRKQERIDARAQERREASRPKREARSAYGVVTSASWQ